MQTLKLTKKYEKYLEYKDSGVEWFGKAPKEWQVVRGKILFESKKDLNKGMKNNNVLSLTMNGVINRDHENNEGLLPSDYQTFQIFDKDDLVFKLIDLENYKTSRVGLVHEKGIMSPVYLRLIAKNKKISQKYYYYLYYHLYIRGIYNFLGSGVRSALGVTDLLEMNLLVPDFQEQNRIVKCLDEKLTLVDNVIERKIKLIELLKERRSLVINATINSLKGNQEKLKYIAPERNIKTDLPNLDAVYLGLENIESNTGKYIPSVEEVLPESSVNIFQKGDILFGKLRPYLAKVFSANLSGVCSGEFLVLKPRENKISSRFLFYKLISRDFIKVVDDSTYGTKMPRANWQFIGNQVIVYPSILEQDKIVTFLDEQTKLYEKTIDSIRVSIEKLKELKSSLISSVVTGKIKV